MAQYSEASNQTRLWCSAWVVFYWDCGLPGPEFDFVSALEGLSVGGRQLLQSRYTRDDRRDRVDNFFLTSVG